jgi:hypothetical protein
MHERGRVLARMYRTYPVCHAQAPYCLRPLTPPHFSTLSHKRHDFREKNSLNTKCVFLFSLQPLSTTFSCKVPVIFVRFYETWIFSTKFRKRLKNKISLKYVQYEPSCSMRTDGYDEANSRFSQFCERALKRLPSTPNHELPTNVNLEEVLSVIQ